MVDKRVRVVVCGEVLCDLFAPRPGVSLATAPHLLPRLGGAPANVAVQLARLGVPVALVTGVGPDPFGARVVAGLAREEVNVSLIRTVAGRRTGATLVEVDSDGERRFFGFREASADLALTVKDVERPAVRRAVATAAVVHSGTVSLRTDNARDATERLQAMGRGAGALISLDVNLRPGMYPDRALMLARASAAVAGADVMKATREEAALLLGRRPRAALRALADGLLACGPRLVMLTDGEHPLLVATAKARVTLDTTPVRVVDATGAGDAFCGAALAALVDGGVGPADLAALDDAFLTRLADAARRAGAAAVTAMGATTAMRRRRRQPSRKTAR